MFYILAKRRIGKGYILFIYKDSVKKVWGMRCVLESVFSTLLTHPNLLLKKESKDCVMYHTKGLHGYRYAPDEKAELIYLDNYLYNVPYFCIYDSKVVYKLRILCLEDSGIVYNIPILSCKLLRKVITEDIPSNLYGLPVLCDQFSLGQNFSYFNTPTLKLNTDNGERFVDYLANSLCNSVVIGSRDLRKTVVDLSSWELHNTPFVTNFCNLTVSNMCDAFLFATFFFYLPQNYLYYARCSFALRDVFSAHVDITASSLRVYVILVLQSKETEIKQVIDGIKEPIYQPCVHLKHFKTYKEVKRQEDTIVNFCKRDFLNKTLLGDTSEVKYIISYDEYGG